MRVLFALIVAITVVGCAEPTPHVQTTPASIDEHARSQFPHDAVGSLPPR